MIEFGNLKVGEQFSDLVQSYPGFEPGGLVPGEKYVKVKPKKIKGREVNAQNLEKRTFCWFAPSHRVEL